MLLRPGFRQWRRRRPFWGASLLVLAGVELFVFGRSGVSLGGVVLQLGFSGMQTTVIPIVVVLAGVLAMLQPVHHIFYGVIGLVLSVYSVVAVNAGGLGIGAVLGIVGSIVIVSWMARPADAAADAASADVVPDAVAADAAAVDGVAADDAEVPTLRLDDLLPPTRAARRSTAAALSVALAAAGLSGTLPADGPCILGFILCDVTLPPLPGQAPSASPSPSSAPEDVPSPSAPADDGAVTEGGDVVGGEDPDPAGTGDDAAPADQTPADQTPAGEPTDPGGAEPDLSVAVPEELPAPDDDALPVALGGNEDVDVFAIPAELKASDLEIAGIQAVTLVSVPVGDAGERRTALKIVADHVVVKGFRLTTFTSDRSGGTRTNADAVTMDGTATMYITSLTASGPDGESLAFDAAHPPTTLTALVLAAINPTIGLLGATSDRQTWSGFEESVWAG